MIEQNKPEVLRMEIESLSRNEEFARVVAAVFMARMDPTLEELDDVKTAVSEAVTNAVIHGYESKGGIVYMEVIIEGQILTIKIRDTGVGIANIPRAMEPMFTTDPEGERSGMGFSFMEAFMDEVLVESEPGKGTSVTMKKKIKG
jgi:stage II sporulation protein AB (anti-sigma F factor)